jgi:beta-carotene hydroxylase
MGDLLETSVLRRRAVLARPLLGVGLFEAAWASGRPWLCPVGVFVAFLCVIATTHDLVHGSLGLRRNGRDLALLLLPALVLQSGHVYRTTHPQHHRVFPGPDDPEGLVADRGLLRALLEGPMFLPRLWVWAYRRNVAHRRQRRLLVVEAAAPVAALATGVLLLPQTGALLAWAVLNVLAGWILPLVTVWLPHRHHGDTPETVAGSLRWPVVPALLLGLTYHLEHHLYPQVPSHHMAELARRLQTAGSALAASRGGLLCGDLPVENRNALFELALARTAPSRQEDAQPAVSANASCSAASRSCSTRSPRRSSEQTRLVTTYATNGPTSARTR